ncbi:MAG: type II secretion system protein [bacterium]|nr:type II secretion system protein [bacterium]MCP4799809.1 type II secretion system protein [bacterium]
MENHKLTKADLALISILVLIIAIALAPHIKSMKVNYRNIEVRHNCRIVQNALEQYALGNNGSYPKYTSEENQNGNTLIDFLPEQALLRNPYSQQFTEPEFFNGKQCGKTQYKPLIINNSCESYVVIGWGICMETPLIELRNQFSNKLALSSN